MKAKSKSVAIWSVVAAMLFLASALPSAYGVDSPMTSRIDIEGEQLATTAAPLENAAAVYSTIELASSPRGSVFSADIALVSNISRQIEMARHPVGAKKVAKAILINEYGFSQKQFTCLNTLWTHESHWNYSAHNRRSGAHGIPQALPATKMEVIATDWRTNPVTQIKWGLAYIKARYSTPCNALLKKHRSHYY
jgi:hypothetical protein